ncbi:MAG TPA: hypothetical protein VKY85_14015 [Candidatus Angelobacter sp.]|nr:hypothetical protein [Candidatus Angelobacter sp.]
MSTAAQKLFELLPALYRLRDAQLAQSQTLLTSAEQMQLTALQALPPASLTVAQQQQLDALLAKAGRGPLQSLVMLLAEQLAIFGDNLDQLYDDQFIETCAPWVVPYIGDLIGYKSVRGIAPAVASPRAEVAHTISFRRRKGTVLVLEQLARDVTGWGAHAVEMFKVLADTQYMDHIRPQNYYAPDLRQWQSGEYINTGFDQTAHKVDVRRIAIQRGRYNIQNIGIFLWSLNAYPLTLAQASPVSGNPQCFRFSSLGRDIPIFNHPISQGADITAPAGPQNVPDRLRRHLLCQDIQDSLAGNPAVYYGVGTSLALYVGGALQSKIRVCNLAGNDGSWSNMPAAGDLPAIDPQLGRIALPPAMPGNVQASFYYGFNADMGGGEYPRSATFTASPDQPLLRVPGDYPTLHDALSALGGAGVVEITDSGTYSEPLGLTLNVKPGGHVELRGAEGCRPTVVLGGESTVSGGAESSLDINGLLIAYAHPSGGAPPAALVHVPAASTNKLGHLGVTHCTLVPGLALTPNGDPDPAYAGIPALLVASAGLQVEITRSIVGALWIDIDASATLKDSIIDAASTSISASASAVAYVAGVDSVTQRPSPGGPLTMSGCTVIGKVHASLLSVVSQCIFWAELSAADTAATPPLWKAPLWAVRKQEGCVRFSYLPAGAIVPRNFKCVKQALGSPQPLFYSLRYGDPAYCKLFSVTDDAIRRGADDGGEMGAFHFLLAPLRESDLRVRITEYLPVGLEFGVFYEN